MRCLLAQTRPPKQIIVIDASQNADQHRHVLDSMLAGTGINLVFQSAVARSSAAQRNQGLSSVTADVVVFIDDDSLLFPDCAEKFMSVFENDREQKIAGLALNTVASLPAAAIDYFMKETKPGNSSAAIERKKGGTAENASLLKYLEQFRFWRFFRREILMQAKDRMFIPYDRYRDRAHDREGNNNAVLVGYLPGCGMVVRTNIARIEKFNSFLCAYCPGEDLDASYRYGRHGLCIFAPDARLNHYEAAGSRIARMQATSLGISNVALFVHTNSDSPIRHRASFAIYLGRRLIGEFLKDLLARRFSFPQARGVLLAIPRSYGIFRRSLPDAQQWYLEQQRVFLGR
ncbi:glycosyltransferase family 2 protein [Paracoccus sp. (in: a-proteobacteria)]|uniref:glycosyltransferase family 2 protein n=1 Tax=Paracoccus sp. TaxID=267 RepID=UPI003A88A176